MMTVHNEESGLSWKGHIQLNVSTADSRTMVKTVTQTTSLRTV